MNGSSNSYRPDPSSVARPLAALPGQSHRYVVPVSSPAHLCVPDQIHQNVGLIRVDVEEDPIGLLNMYIEGKWLFRSWGKEELEVQWSKLARATILAFDDRFVLSWIPGLG